MGPAAILGLFNLINAVGLFFIFTFNNLIINCFTLNKIIFLWPSSLVINFFLLVFFLFLFFFINYIFSSDLKSNTYLLFFILMSGFFYFYSIFFNPFLFENGFLTNLHLLDKGISLFFFSWGSNLHAFILLFWRESSFLFLYLYIIMYKYAISVFFLFFFFSLWGGVLGSFWSLTSTTPPFLWANDWVELFTFFSYLFFVFILHVWPKKIKNYEIIFNSFFFFLFFFQVWGFWTFHHDSANNLFINNFELIWLYENYFIFYSKVILFFFSLYYSLPLLYYFFHYEKSNKVMVTSNIKKKKIKNLNLKPKLINFYISINLHIWFFIILVFLPLSFFCVNWFFCGVFFSLWGCIFFFYTGIASYFNYIKNFNKNIIKIYLI